MPSVDTGEGPTPAVPPRTEGVVLLPKSEGEAAQPLRECFIFSLP